jgi:SAM-dependent methyltransferase
MSNNDTSGQRDERAVVAEFADHIAPYKQRKDVDFWVEMARESGGPVLEIGCGTGRVVLPIARAGIGITGLDLSPAMLSICRQKVAHEPPAVRHRVQLVEGDMRRFDLDREFALVTTPFRPFQHLLSVEDQLECLRTIHRHLSSSGRLVLDLFNPSLHLLVSDTVGIESGDEPEFAMPDGRRILHRDCISARDLFNQVQNVEAIYYVTYPDSRRERVVHSFPMRYLFRFEAEHLLERCGFQVENVYADFDRSPFGSKYPGELIAVARKT